MNNFIVMIKNSHKIPKASHEISAIWFPKGFSGASPSEINSETLTKIVSY